MPTALIPFQVKGVRGIHKFGGRCLLADEMGLGKSVETAAWAAANPDSLPLVVVCPAFLKDQWATELKIHMGIRAQVLDGEKPMRHLPLVPPKAVIVNFDILQYWLKYLKKLKPNLVVVDEIQSIKNRKSIRTGATYSLVSGVKYLLFLGGTGGLEKSPVDLWPIVNMLRPDKFPSFRRFANRYCEPKKIYGRWTFNGATNLDELHRKLKKYCLVRRKQEAMLPDLPPQHRVIVPIKLGRIDEYKQAEKDFKNWLRRVKMLRRRMGRKNRAMALAKIGYLKRLAAELKIRPVLQWLDNFLDSTDRKIILFFIHKKIGKILQRHFGEIAVKIDGSTPRDQRRIYVKQFNEQKRKKVFLGQLKATGVGWSSRSANEVGFIELGWNPTEHTQGEKRVHGLYRGIEGQPCFAYYFIAKDTIEERVCALNQKKQKDIDAILDGGVSSNFNIFNQLLQELSK